MSFEKIRWAARVRQAWIWQLYQADASGAPDEELLPKTGWALLARVENILMVRRGELTCPRCGTVFRLDPNAETLQICPADCGWGCTRADFHASWRHQDLMAQNALEAFETFARLYPLAQTPEERMFRIDRLLHAFHWDSKFNLPNRSAANNLIEGSHNEVVAMLDRLSSAKPSPENLEWRKTVEIMKRRRRGQV